MRSVTIIICTRNRAGSLGETLASVGACCVPADVDGEVLVVDNGSTDDTPAAVATAALTNLSVRCVREPRPGKGYAYNAGMAAARGNAFLFTDDDVRVPRDWIEGMCRPLLDGTADAVAGGVRFAGHLRREWMTAQQRAWLASTDQLPDEPNWRMVGANMAFARHVLTRVPGFDVELGPGGLGFGDETLFAHQIVAAGFRTVRRLGVEVEHHFDPERLTRSSLLKLAEKMGRSGAYVEHHWLHYHRSTPRLKWVKHVIELGVRRACRLVRHGVRHQPPVSQWELDLCREIGTFAQARVEQNRPRRYERHGRHGLARLDPGT